MFFTMLERWLVVSTLWWLVPGMLLRFDFGAGGWVPLDFWWGGVIGIYLVKKLLIDRQWLSYPLFWPGAAFITWAFFTLIWQGSDLLPLERILSGAYLVQWVWWWIWGYLVFSVVRVAEHRASLIKHLEWILALVLVGGLIQFQWFPNLGSWSVEGGWDPHSGRLFGTWLDPNFIAGFLALSAPVLWEWFYSSPWGGRKIFRGILFLLLIIAAFLTFSRSGYLALAIGLLLFWVRRTPWMIGISALALMVAVSFNFRVQERLIQFTDTLTSIIQQDPRSVDPTAQLRIDSWRDSLALWEEGNHWTGIGYNTYRYRAAQAGLTQENFHSAGGADSSLLTILVTTGFIGLGLIFWLLFVLLWPGIQFWAAQIPPLQRAFAAGTVGLLVHACFVNSLWYPFIALWWLVLWVVSQRR